MSGKKPPKIKQRLLHLMLIAMVLPGLVISIVGIMSLSQQKKARELNLEEKYRNMLVQIRDEIEKNIEEKIGESFWDLSTKQVNLLGNTALQAGLKEVLLKNPIIKYPFIINSQGAFLFPMSKKASRHLAGIPRDRGQDTPTGRLFRQGENAEFKEREFEKAIKFFLQALEETPERDIVPYIYNAIARCYFKLKKYPQATAYLGDMINRYKVQLSKDRGLLFSSLFQYALALKQLGSRERTAKIYLRLYDALLEHELTGDKEQYSFFKNEALAYLAGYFDSNRDENKVTPTHALEEQLKSMTPVDIALSWEFYEVDRLSPETKGEPSDEFRFRKLQEFYLSTVDKSLFYNNIKRLSTWKNPVASNMGVDTISLSPGAGPVNMAFHKMGVPPGGNGQSDLFFGFLVSDYYIESAIFPAVIKKIVKDDSLRVILTKGTTPFSQGETGYQPMTLSFRQFLPEKSVVLYFPGKDHIRMSVKRELWLNYGLIAALVTALLFGIIFFYKYMSREAQMVSIKAAFVDSASHTLKTPLTRIRMLAEKMELGWIKDKSKKQNYLRTIMAETDRMSEMISNMLDFSKIEARKKEYEKEHASFADCLNAVMNRYTRNLEDLGFKVELEIVGSLPDFKFDLGAMQMIMTNLIQNAVKYSREEKFLRVKVIREQSTLFFSVTDRGIGIPASMLDKIFEKFYRVPDSRVNATEGSGLGLFLVQHAVKAHEGDILIRSKPGLGTTITVRFPLRERG